MRGAIPTSRNRLAAARPFKRMFTPPNEIVRLISKLNVWGNDSHGNCTGAEIPFARGAMAPNTYVDPNEVIAWCSRNNCLEGAMIEDVLNSEQEDPLPGTPKILSGPHASVNYMSVDDMKAALAQETLKIGMDAGCLENAGAGNSNGWAVVNAPKATNYDHCIPFLGYGTAGSVCDKWKVPVPSNISKDVEVVEAGTWGTVGMFDWQSVFNVLCEAWIRHPTNQTDTPTPIPVPTPWQNIMAFIQELIAWIESLFSINFYPSKERIAMQVLRIAVNHRIGGIDWNKAILIAQAVMNATPTILAAGFPADIPLMFDLAGQIIAIINS